jgi:hypothetical protein
MMSEKRKQGWKKKLKEMGSKELRQMAEEKVTSLINTGTATNPLGNNKEILCLVFDVTFERLERLTEEIRLLRSRI